LVIVKLAGIVDFLIALVLVLTASTARATDAVPITSLRAIHALSNAEASRGLPVAFSAWVTYYRKGNVDLFVQEGDFAVYVETTVDRAFSAGDRVLVIGKTRPSFRPEIKSEKVIFLGHGSAPAPVKANFRQLIRAELDCRRATIRGTVRSANIVTDGALRNIYLQVQMDGGSVDAEMAEDSSTDLHSLLDAEVEITGAVAGKFDSKMQMTGILMEVQSISDVKIIRQASVSPTLLPVTPMDEILSSYHVLDHTERVKVKGTITYYQPGLSIVLQNKEKSLLVKTQYEQPIHVGDLATATGFPDVQNGALTLTRAEIEDTGLSSPVSPVGETAEDLALGNHAFDLVSIEGELLTAVRQASQDEYVLISNGHLFKAIFKHPEHGINLQPPPMSRIAAGSKVRVTGICLLANGDKSQDPVAFNILLRSSGDLAVIGGPSLLNVHDLIYMVGLLLCVLIVMGVIALRTERRARSQTARLARMEQKRSRILEDINGSVPIAEIIDKITEMVSFKLHGAPCWCELSDGRHLGSQPEQFLGLRTVESVIHARSGSQLGMVFAAFHAATKPVQVETETLSMAAGLIALALETRRLYSDLQRRSEFDLLTELHNRFSLEKRLDEMIDEAGKAKESLGLIYIDLDGFKLINDVYGHQIGDRYLQQVTLRLKHQLRPTDMMARLGGDEFAVVVPAVKTHEDVRAVVARLENCFANPFAIDGNQLRGSASFGVALFPNDGSTQDSLLNSADAAMYVDKNAKRRSTQAETQKARLEVIR
jgi:diguanylate cyclase (GGDEF)-like protein